MKARSAEMRASDAVVLQARRKAEVTSDPLEKLRLLCLAKGPGGMLELGRVFRRLEGSGQLGLEEFCRGIEDAGVGLTQDQAAELFRSFDTGGTGSVSVEEFLLAVRPKMSEARKISVGLAFEKLDRAGEGVITLEDLRGVYNVKSQSKYHSGVESEDQILKEFMANFEQGCVNGIITKEEFMNYYAGVSASIDTDAFFDLMIRQSYKI